MALDAVLREGARRTEVRTAELPVASPLDDVFVTASAIVRAKIFASDFAVRVRFLSDPTRDPSMAERTWAVMSLIAIKAPTLIARHCRLAARVAPPPSALMSDLSLASG